jgi:alkylation response protein AidB-like acyl-CoA dehydrogenase
VNKQPADILEAERRRFDAAVEGEPAWFRFCPNDVGRDEILRPIGAYLRKPETLRRLEACEMAEAYPSEIVEDLKSLGLSALFCDLGPPDPKATAYHLSALNVLTARTTASLAITVGVNCLALLAAYRGASPGQLEQILGHVRQGAFSALALTELEQGSDLASTQSVAESGFLSADGVFIPQADAVAPTHYRLKAHRHLINGGTHHRLLFILLRTSQRGDVISGETRKWTSHSLFWLLREAVPQRVRRWTTLPARAADISEVVLNDAVIEEGQRIGTVGGGFGLIQETLAMSRGGVASLAAGTLSRARDLTVKYARNRHLYGRSIGRLGGIAAHLARLDALDRVATAASLRATAWVNACGSGAAPYTAVAKFMSCRLAEEGVTEGRHVLGARALLRDLPYERLIRDVGLFGVFDGTSHLMLDELQVILSLETRRWLTSSGTQPDTVVEARSVYDRPPRSLVEAARAVREHRPVPLAIHARNLGALPGAVPLQSVSLLAEALFSLCDAAKRRGKWSEDQSLRFVLAEVYAMVEALIALVELFDPDRRTALITRGPLAYASDAPGYHHALGWLGSRACALLLEGAAGAGLQPQQWREGALNRTGGVAGLQAVFLAGYDQLRKDLAAALLEEEGRRPHTSAVMA